MYLLVSAILPQVVSSENHRQFVLYSCHPSSKPQVGWGSEGEGGAVAVVLFFRSDNGHVSSSLPPRRAIALPGRFVPGTVFILLRGHIGLTDTFRRLFRLAMQ